MFCLEIKFFPCFGNWYFRFEWNPQFATCRVFLHWCGELSGLPLVPSELTAVWSNALAQFSRTRRQVNTQQCHVIEENHLWSYITASDTVCHFLRKHHEVIQLFVPLKRFYLIMSVHCLLVVKIRKFKKSWTTNEPNRENSLREGYSLCFMFSWSFHRFF